MPYKDKDKQREARKRYEEKNKAERGERRENWALICYPDSMPADWREQISDLHIPVTVSPLHDKDSWTAKDERENPKHKEGTLKKPHYHLIALYGKTTSKKEFLDDFAFLNGPSNVKAVKSLRSLTRYHAHLDDPEKAQYSIDDIQCFCGADLDCINEVGKAERHLMLRAMRKFIRDEGFVDFCEFIDYCDANEESWSRLLNDNSSYVIEKYISSRRAMMKARGGLYNRRLNGEVRIDKLTGELIEVDEQREIDYTENEMKGGEQDA